MSSVLISIDMTGFQALPEGQIDDEVIAEWVEDRLNDARNHFIKNMGRSGGGGGRTYKSGKNSTHTASAPGEYPKTDGGRLANSVDYQMTSDREGVLGSDVEYALYLTTGTTKMAPRKMFSDAIDDILSERPETDALVRAATFSLNLGTPGGSE